MTSSSRKKPQTTMCSPKNLEMVEVKSGVNEKRWRVHKKREHTMNKRGKPKRERTQRTRGANLGVVEVQSRDHVCAHK